MILPIVESRVCSLPHTISDVAKRGGVVDTYEYLKVSVHYCTEETGTTDLHIDKLLPLWLHNFNSDDLDMVSYIV